MLSEYTTPDLEVLSLSAIQAKAAVAICCLQGILGVIIRVRLQALLGGELGGHTALASGRMWTDVGLPVAMHDMLSVGTFGPSGLDRWSRLDFE